MSARLDQTARQRTLRKVASLHYDEYADLLVAERLRVGLPPEADRRSRRSVAGCVGASGDEATQTGTGLDEMSGTGRTRRNLGVSVIATSPGASVRR